MKTVSVRQGFWPPKYWWHNTHAHKELKAAHQNQTNLPKKIWAQDQRERGQKRTWQHGGNVGRVVTGGDQNGSSRRGMKLHVHLMPTHERSKATPLTQLFNSSGLKKQSQMRTLWFERMRAKVCEIWINLNKVLSKVFLINQIRKNQSSLVNGQGQVSPA